jgi:hypothetical protein
MRELSKYPDGYGVTKFPAPVALLIHENVLFVHTTKGWRYVIDEKGDVWRCTKIKAKVRISEPQESSEPTA